MAVGDYSAAAWRTAPDREGWLESAALGNMLSNVDMPRLQLPCPHGGATNRLPAGRIDDAPDCGGAGGVIV